MADAKQEPKRQEKIAVTIPRMGVSEESYVLVGINGVLTQVPRGRTVMVSREVYDILRRSTTARDVSEAFLTGNAHRSLGRL